MKNLKTESHSKYEIIINKLYSFKIKSSLYYFLIKNTMIFIISFQRYHNNHKSTNKLSKAHKFDLEEKKIPLNTKILF